MKPYVWSYVIPECVREYWILIMVTMPEFDGTTAMITGIGSIYGMDEMRVKLHKEICAHYGLEHADTVKLTDNLQRFKSAREFHHALQDITLQKEMAK